MQIIQPEVLEIPEAKLNGKKTSRKNCRKFGYTSQGCPRFGNLKKKAVPFCRGTDK